MPTNMKTTMAHGPSVTHPWKLVDADGQPVGRLAVAIANLLRGKDRPDYTPHVCTGAMVVVINAANVRFTGSKETSKIYRRYSGYPGGLKQYTPAMIRPKNPAFLLRHAVSGMLPKNHTRAVLLRRLKIYAGPEHPHTAQKPEPVELRV